MSSVSLARSRRTVLPALRLSDGAIEALKWLALALMVLDHVNKYLWHDTVRAAFDLGRSAMPIFAIVLGFNLARGLPDNYRRVATRLAISGGLATIPFISLGGLGWGWWPLNIMATLLTATLVCGAFASGHAVYMALASVLFLIAGTSVEFWWPGIALCVAAWSYARAPNWPALLIGLVSLLALRAINGNDFALLTLPVLAAATRWHWTVPRVRHFFYAFYPLHLAALWLLQRAP